MTQQNNFHSAKLLEGFTFDDYLTMFQLTEQQLSGKIFDFPGGLSSFNATATSKGISVISADPIYDMNLEMLKTLTQQQRHLWQEQINRQIDKESKQIAEQKAHQFSVASSAFLDDFDAGKSEGRYIAWQSEQPLPLTNQNCQLALCSHWLFKQPFTFVQQLDFIEALCRVAGEVRIFPICNSDFESNEHFPQLMAYLQQKGYKLSCIAISFDKHNPGDAMLSIVNPHCTL